MSAWRWIFRDASEPLIVDLSDKASSIKIVQFLTAIDYKPADRWPPVRRQS